MTDIACVNCGAPFPESGLPYCCPKCGGLFDLVGDLNWHAAELNMPGVWKYASPPDPAAHLISLGEGRTALVRAEVARRPVFFKCETSNPTGSFKDRGSAVLVSLLLSRGIREAVEDSSGNAGASFAAYAAHAGVSATVFCPQDASNRKRTQIESYGARLVPIPGPRASATAAALKAVERGAVYASHAYLPHSIAGYASCSYEIFEQLGEPPGSVILPVGQGGLLLGIGRGFIALRSAGRIDELPVLVGVQAAACAPLVALYEVGMIGLELVTEGSTVAEGVRVRTPLRAKAVLDLIAATGGKIVAINEEAILPARDALAALGFYVEPTSALVWPALMGILPHLRDPVVVVLTGSGYKGEY